jgi:hypothetical protein
MSKWLQFPDSMPENSDVCWIRIKYYYGEPFQAYWDVATLSFVSLVNSIPYHASLVSRWRAVYGPELIDQVTWCDATMSFWSSKGANISGDGTKLIFAAGSTNCYKSNLFAARKVYRCELTIVRTSGTIYALYNGSTGAIVASASGSYSKYTTYSVLSPCFLASTPFVGEVTALSVRELL